MKKNKIFGAFSFFTGGYFLKKYCEGGYNAYSPDMTGKNVIVTGGNSGIGKETARELFNLNANIIITGRNSKKAQDFIDSLPKPKENQKKVKFFKSDFSDIENVEKLFDEISKEFDSGIDIIVNNAGATNLEYRRSKQNLELTMAVNHLAPVYLTSLLFPLLRTESRVVNVASIAHKKNGNLQPAVPNFRDFWFNCEDKDYVSEYKYRDPYSRSKLANILFTSGLAKNIEKKEEIEVKTTSLHPGVIDSDFWREFDNNSYFKFFRIFLSPLLWLTLKNDQGGAQTTLHCCLAPYEEFENGGYYSDCRLGKVSIHAKDDDNIQKCWEVTNKQIYDLSGHIPFSDLK